ncbi:MAG: flagellar export chaperone FliS [Desulfotignum sp.]|nr:flagellar export chaperone FliS [Desulfotignum sp.]MCF8088436.1 flagellar export chaperone FliS [Desulfotignum sp.]MCF8136437.1 flagellar export chaperone FliS [Desulfotignum sp.]
MIPSGYGRYAKAAVAVEKKEDILLLLLDAASMDLKKARMGIEDNNPKVKGESISRAISILTELDCALDHGIGTDMTENLSRLYHFVMDRLTFANLKNDLTAMDEADQVLDQVHDAFKEAVKTYKGDQRPESTTSYENGEDTFSQMTGKLSVAV